MKHTVLFPGTFDPITNGHLHLIERASLLFSRIVIAVAADTQGKTTCFSLDERKALVGNATAEFSNVHVITYHGLTVHCAEEHHAHAILRGVRSGSDFDYEHSMALMNLQLAPEIETLFLTPSQQFIHISASLVRQVAQLQGDVSRFVPANVEQALVARFGKP
jgi:pantetheine-phosphate adenylyltransferase